MRNARLSRLSIELTWLVSSVEGIRSDLTTERPLYALTCYAAAKGEPNLIGEQDESPEELRWRFYQARIQNNPGLYVRRAALTALMRQLLTFCDLPYSQNKT